MRMALWNVFQIQPLKDVGFRGSKWNWTWCGLWGRAWCAPEAIKAQPFQKIITLGTCLPTWSSPSPCRVSSSSPLMAEGPPGPPVSLLLCAAGAEPACPGVARLRAVLQRAAEGVPVLCPPSSAPALACLCLCTRVTILTCKHGAFGPVAMVTPQNGDSSPRQYIPSLNEMHSSVFNL